MQDGFSTVFVRLGDMALLPPHTLPIMPQVAISRHNPVLCPTNTEAKSKLTPRSTLVAEIQLGL